MKAPGWARYTGNLDALVHFAQLKVRLDHVRGRQAWTIWNLSAHALRFVPDGTVAVKTDQGDMFEAYACRNLERAFERVAGTEMVFSVGKNTKGRLWDRRLCRSDGTAKQAPEGRYQLFFIGKLYWRGLGPTKLGDRRGYVKVPVELASSSVWMREGETHVSSRVHTAKLIRIAGKALTFRVRSTDVVSQRPVALHHTLTLGDQQLTPFLIDVSAGRAGILVTELRRWEPPVPKRIQRRKFFHALSRWCQRCGVLSMSRISLRRGVAEVYTTKLLSPVVQNCLRQALARWQKARTTRRKLRFRIVAPPDPGMLHPTE